LWIVDPAAQEDIVPTHLVATLDVRDFGAETLRIGDLNGDGAPDLLFVQNIYGTRAITCLTATTLAGEVLWQRGAPSPENGFIYGDLPVQIYDWDGDGVNEVLYVQQASYAELPPGTGWLVERALRYEGAATLIVLDALTGAEKIRLALPAPADDCFLFADLTGSGRRQDLVVKDRYWQMWGLAHDGRVLWHWTGATGHFPALGDVDGDGRDEVFVGYALLDHDGRVLWQHDDGGQHQDAAAMVKLADGSWRLLFGNGGAHCLAADGTRLWHHPLDEAQHVVPGRFRLDSEVQFMVINRDQRRGDPQSRATLYLYDLEGRELWRREQPAGSWAASGVRLGWFGPGAPDALLVHSRGLVTCEFQGDTLVYGYEPPAEGEAIYDGEGALVDTVSMQYPTPPTPADLRCGYYALAADVWGDSRDEVILFGSRGACVHANARPLAVPTLYNETLYPGV
jgi:hypothetical protein